MAKSLNAASKLYDPADDTDLSAGVTPAALSFDVSNSMGNKHLSRLTFQPVFSGYTSVTVKAQATLDNTTWADISGATTSTSGAIVSFAITAYHAVRLYVTGTLSGGTDTMEVWVRQEFDA